jgi:hypothetical protein
MLVSTHQTTRLHNHDEYNINFPIWMYINIYMPAACFSMRRVHCTAVLTDVTLVGPGIDIDKLWKTVYVAVHFDRNMLET